MKDTAYYCSPNQKLAASKSVDNRQYATCCDDKDDILDDGRGQGSVSSLKDVRHASKVTILRLEIFIATYKTGHVEDIDKVVEHDISTKELLPISKVRSHIITAWLAEREVT